MEQTTFTRAQLAQAFETGQPIPIPENPPIFDPVKLVYRHVLDLDMVLVLTSNALAWPMKAVSVIEQAGRFILVNYTPVGSVDPDAIIVLESGPAADEFHKTMRNFQALRRQPVTDWARWFAAARGFVKLMIPPLWALQPSAEEANFVLRWAMVTVAKGSLISGPRMQWQDEPHGEFYGHPNF